MQTLHRVLICGLGALGGMFAQRLAATPGVDLAVVADPDRVARYRRDGVTVNGASLEVAYLAPGEVAPPADLILIGTKWHQLDEAVAAVKGFVGPDTLVLSLLNGIASEDVIAAALGAEHGLPCFVVETDATRHGQAIVYGKLGTIVFGEDRNPTVSPRVAAVAELLTRAGIPHRVPADMLRELWWKFMLNVGCNQVSAVLRARYGVFQRDAEARDLIRAACREVVALAQAAGIALSEADIDGIFVILDRLSPDKQTSMLQDIEAGRPTEVDIFGGTVVAEGRRLGIPTPVNALLAGLIRVMERMGSDESVST